MPVSSPTSLPSETEGDPHRGLVVHADYFHGRIDYKAFRAKNGDYPVVASDPLVLEPLSGSYAVLTRFGGLVFWSCPHDVQQELREAVAALPGAGERSEAVSDVIEVLVGERRDRVGFDRVAVRKLTKEKVKVISMALAQSVALEHFENRVSEALHQSEPIVARLRAKGRLSQSETEIIQAVGFALEVRSAVLAKLTLFDDPPEAWESATIARLVARLHDHFNLNERLEAIKEKVDYLTDLNSALLDLLSNRKSRRLEWIIIILIAVEILFFLYLEIVRGAGH